MMPKPRCPECGLRIRRDVERHRAGMSHKRRVEERKKQHATWEGE